MKAIKDCEWEVSIEESKCSYRYTRSGYNYKWLATTKQNCAILGSTLDSVWLHYKQSAKRNWEKFAKLNGIRKWKYV